MSDLDRKIAAKEAEVAKIQQDLGSFKGKMGVAMKALVEHNMPPEIEQHFGHLDDHEKAEVMRIHAKGRQRQMAHALETSKDQYGNVVAKHQHNAEYLKHHDKIEDATLGIVRLDYNYPASPGDIDCPETYDYDVFYKVVPGLTFQMCQDNTMTKEVADDFAYAVKFLDRERSVSAITGDCGFMMWFQSFAREQTKKPVFMSALCQLPAITGCYDDDELIMIMTANAKTLEPMHDTIKDQCGVETHTERYIIVGCETVPGFEAVELGLKVDTVKVEPGIVKKALETIKQNPKIKCILMECTELPPYSDAVRAATGLPVFDAITGCDYFISGFRDNERFGMNDWQKEWDGQQEEYVFGQDLNKEQRKKLQTGK